MAGLEGPGSPKKNESLEIRETVLEVALNWGSGAYALAGRDGVGGNGCVGGSGGGSEGSKKGFDWRAVYTDDGYLDTGLERSAV